ncbi:MAG: glycosyltransferase [Lachnospiraceae bacterium]|jgi:glycosyltransferase involved in cell wall biosynthesis|nr:glycosyltransferase [Lachnospiraceae bacterium]
MKILIINKFLHPNGGSETYIFGIGRGLASLGHEVEFFGMEHPQRIVGNRAESYTANMDFRARGVKRLTYPFRIIYSHEARKKLRAVLSDFRPSVVHLNNFNFQLTPSILYEIRSFAKKTKDRIKIVYTAHDYQLLCPNHIMKQYISGECCTRCISANTFNCTRYKCIHGSFIKSLLGSIEALVYRRLRTYRLIDVIICPTNFMKKALANSSILKEKTIVLHNFIEVNDDSLTDEAQNKDTYVLYFGRYSPEKGVGTLLHVARQLPEVRFIFAGMGPLNDSVNELLNITNKGFLGGRELNDLIKGAQFALFPSEWYENCPFAVMEAISLGTPVIAADIGGMPELIRAGVNGDLFISGDAEDLREKVSLLWNDRERREAYRTACNQSLFLSLDEYCKKLLEEIYV